MPTESISDIPRGREYERLLQEGPGGPFFASESRPGADISRSSRNLLLPLALVVLAVALVLSALIIDGFNRSSATTSAQISASNAALSKQLSDNAIQQAQQAQSIAQRAQTQRTIDQLLSGR